MYICMMYITMCCFLPCDPSPISSRSMARRPTGVPPFRVERAGGLQQRAELCRGSGGSFRANRCSLLQLAAGPSKTSF